MNINNQSLIESFEIVNNSIFKFNNENNRNTNIIIPEGITSIEERAFENSTNIENVIIPQSVRKIDNFAFHGCTNLKTVTFPENIHFIGKGIFAECPAIGNFIYSNSNISYSFVNGFEVLNNCLTYFDYTINKNPNLYIPEGITTIGEKAFYNCNKILVITLPESVTAIENGAFSYCTALSVIDIPANIINFGRGLFSHCKNLMPVRISNRLTSYYFVNGLEIHDRSLTFFDSSINKGNIVEIPNGVTAIGEYAFSNCTRVISIIFPNGMKMIEDGAFANTGIVEMTIPEGITYIGKETFRGCANLERVNIPASIKYVDKTAFSDCPRLNNNFNSNIVNSNSTINNTLQNNYKAIETYFGLEPLLK